ncbi:MAG: response regulator, partial [Calditrichaeota bacterium]|nr:response regulator [Calditrichota bacterium]
MTTLQGYAGSNNHHVNTILVVDDVPENLRLLEDLLSGQGYKINATTSGHLAVQSILCNPPDLILLDI